MKTFAQLAILLREHFKPTRLKIEKRDIVSILLFSNKGSLSLTSAVHELKKLAVTYEFTNEQ